MTEELKKLRREVNNFLNALAEQDMDIEGLQKSFDEYEIEHANQLMFFAEKQKILEDKLETVLKSLDSLKKLVTDKYGKKDETEKKSEQKPKVPWNPRPSPFPPPYVPPIFPRPKRFPPPYIPEKNWPDWPLPYNGDEIVWTSDRFEVGYCNTCGRDLMQQGAGDVVCQNARCPFITSVSCNK